MARLAPSKLRQVRLIFFPPYRPSIGPPKYAAVGPPRGWILRGGMSWPIRAVQAREGTEIVDWTPLRAATKPPIFAAIQPTK
jgi:hypothetical protein